MMDLFLLSLLLTFLIERSWAYFHYKSNNYFDDEENPKTLTGWLRTKTGFDWKSVHFGALIFFITSLLIYSNGFTAINNILLGISLSIILDQIFPLIGNWNYFNKKMFAISALLHLIAALIAIKIS